MIKWFRAEGARRNVKVRQVADAIKDVYMAVFRNCLDPPALPGLCLYTLMPLAIDNDLRVGKGSIIRVIAQRFRYNAADKGRQIGRRTQWRRHIVSQNQVMDPFKCLIDRDSRSVWRRQRLREMAFGCAVSYNLQSKIKIVFLEKMFSLWLWNAFLSPSANSVALHPERMPFLYLRPYFEALMFKFIQTRCTAPLPSTSSTRLRDENSDEAAKYRNEKKSSVNVAISLHWAEREREREKK